MAVASLREIAFRRVDHLATSRKLKSVADCPYDLIEPILRQVTVHQLLVLEASSPSLLDVSQPLWRMHTLKQFPTIAETHDLDSAAAAEADWRLVYHELLEERQEREQLARDKLKAKYNHIASGKSERKIQVIKKAEPTRSQIRATAGRASGALPRKGLSSIMGKALKATIGSAMHASHGPSMPVRGQSARPNPNTRITASPTRPRATGPPEKTPMTSKLLLPIVKKARP